MYTERVGDKEGDAGPGDETGFRGDGGRDTGRKMLELVFDLRRASTDSAALNLPGVAIALDGVEGTARPEPILDRAEDEVDPDIVEPELRDGVVERVETDAAVRAGSEFKLSAEPGRVGMTREFARLGGRREALRGEGGGDGIST